MPRGALWALVGALCYSAYIVFLRRKIDTEDKLDVPMFFGFVGIVGTFLILLFIFAPVGRIQIYLDTSMLPVPNFKNLDPDMTVGLYRNLLSINLKIRIDAQMLYIYIYISFRQNIVQLS